MLVAVASLAKLNSNSSWSLTCDSSPIALSLRMLADLFESHELVVGSMKQQKIIDSDSDFKLFNNRKQKLVTGMKSILPKFRLYMI